MHLRSFGDRGARCRRLTADEAGAVKNDIPPFLFKDSDGRGGVIACKVRKAVAVGLLIVVICKSPDSGEVKKR